VLSNATVVWPWAEAQRFHPIKGRWFKCAPRQGPCLLQVKVLPGKVSVRPGSYRGGEEGNRIAEALGTRARWAPSQSSGAIIAIPPGQSPDDAQTKEAQPDYHEHHVRGHLEYFDENDAHAGKRDECPGHHEARTGGSHVRHLLTSVRSAFPKGILRVSYGAWLAVQYPAHGSALRAATEPTLRRAGSP
jgi:hypothetical protein